jgi:hypothetical protein
MSRQFLILLVAALNSPNLLAQSAPPSADLLDGGILCTGGYSHLAVKDQYLSEEKYSGAACTFALGWLQGDTSSANRLGLSLTNATGIRNNNVSAQVLLGSLAFDLLYPVGSFRFLVREFYVAIGPSAEISLYYRQQHIASGGNAMFNAYSFALLFSIGGNATVVVPLSSDLAVEGSARLALLSLAGRLADLHDNNASFFKPVTVFSGLWGVSEVLFRYDVNEYLSVKVGYRFDIRQSCSWDYLIAASDNALLSLVIRI